MIFAFLLASCQTPVEKNFANQPLLSMPLEKELDEISGLSFMDDETLALLQDEEGKIYLFDLQKEIIKEQIKFKDEGDFEGLTYNGEHFFALESDGDIYRIDSKGKAKRFEFDLSNKSGFDFEGLCFDKRQNQLLVACKKHPKKKHDESIWIYRFDLVKSRYEDIPFLKIEKSALDTQVRPSALYLSEDRSIWMLSASTHTLFHLNEKGELMQRYRLDKSLYPQAEGICITSDNSIYIATEKKHNSAAYIHQLELDQ